MMRLTWAKVTKAVDIRYQCSKPAHRFPSSAGEFRAP